MKSQKFQLDHLLQDLDLERIISVEASRLEADLDLVVKQAKSPSKSIEIEKPKADFQEVIYYPFPQVLELGFHRCRVQALVNSTELLKISLNLCIPADFEIEQHDMLVEIAKLSAQNPNLQIIFDKMVVLPSLSLPILFCVCRGKARKTNRVSVARKIGRIFQIEPIGMAATSILSRYNRAAVELIFDQEFLNLCDKQFTHQAKRLHRLENFVNLSSSTFMQIPENGIAGLFNDFFESENGGSVIEFENVLISPEAKMLADYLNIDCMALDGVGSLIAICDDMEVHELVKLAADFSLEISEIGRATENQDGNFFQFDSQLEKMRMSPFGSLASYLQKRIPSFERDEF